MYCMFSHRYICCVVLNVLHSTYSLSSIFLLICTVMFPNLPCMLSEDYPVPHCYQFPTTYFRLWYWRRVSVHLHMARMALYSSTAATFQTSSSATDLHASLASLGPLLGWIHLSFSHHFINTQSESDCWKMKVWHSLVGGGCEPGKGGGGRHVLKPNTAFGSLSDRPQQVSTKPSSIYSPWRAQKWHEEALTTQKARQLWGLKSSWAGTLKCTG